MPERFLIVNADDFGLCPGVNRGIIRAHEHGVVTSASLMVRYPAAGEAATYARASASLGVGLHVDLGEWVFAGGEWLPAYEVVPQDNYGAVEHEVERQLELFRDLVGREPTHLDSHQHAHEREPARTILKRVAAELGVPLRNTTVRWIGKFYGQDGQGRPLPNYVAVPALIGIIRTLPAGITEVSCHPGEADGLDSVYREERAREIETLCDPAVRAAISEAGVSLVAYGHPVVRTSLELAST